MPEIVDLEVSRENMLRRVHGKKVMSVSLNEPKVLRNARSDQLTELITGRPLSDIGRHGKALEFSFGETVLACHLMLHGDFCWKDDDAKKHRNVACELQFENCTTILFKDWSKWMKLEIYDEKEGLTSDLLLGKKGIDALDTKFTRVAFCDMLTARPRSGIKGFLMDQAMIAGIGNAYCDESLFDCGIHPTARCSQILSREKDGFLHESIMSVIHNGITIVRELSGGVSISEQDRDFMKVYRKSGSACPRCGYMIACIKVNGRDTFVCEKCQPR